MDTQPVATDDLLIDRQQVDRDFLLRLSSKNVYS